jgi:hypothetical protein
MQHECGQGAGERKLVPRDFQDRLEFDDFMLCAFRSASCASKADLYLHFDVLNLFGIVFVLVLVVSREDGRTLRTPAPHYTLGEHLI